MSSGPDPTNSDWTLNREKRKAHWDLKYDQGLTSLTESDPFFLFAYGQFVYQSFPNAGVALDLACGLGRHALWLASRGWQVSGVDISEVAIGKLNHAALETHPNTNLVPRGLI
jgi:2-polyprenyl-3-methyl-5-hydroxy-6-metoxy-1,4-benzoquinol methylase